MLQHNVLSSSNRLIFEQKVLATLFFSRTNVVLHIQIKVVFSISLTKINLSSTLTSPTVRDLLIC